MRLLLAILLLFTRLTIDAQQASASAGTYSLKIGEQTQITLQAKPRQNEKVVWPILTDSLGPYFDIVTKEKIDTLRDSVSGNQSYRQRLLITSFDTGMFTLPVFAFTFIQSNGDSTSIVSDALTIAVKSVAVDTTQAIKDIKGVQDIPFELREYIPWVFAGIAIAALIVGGIYLWLQRRKPTKPVAPKAPPVPPGEKALAALRKLGEERAWLNGQEKRYHSSLTDILRSYIEEQFGLPALESTSEDILMMSSRHAVLKEHALRLKQVLQLADLVKFAKANPLPVEHEHSLTLAFEFVQSTQSISERKEVPLV